MVTMKCLRHHAPMCPATITDRDHQRQRRPRELSTSGPGRLRCIRRILHDQRNSSRWSIGDRQQCGMAGWVRTLA